MGKTTVEQKSNQHIVMNKLTYPEAINERELHAIAGGLMESLIPVTTEKSKKGWVIKTSVEGMMTLQSYFSSLVTKKMFLDVLAELVSIVKECEKNLLNINNLMLADEYIFLDPRTKKVKCIYWPMVNNHDAKSLSEFFHELPFRVVFSKHENHDYVKTYLSYFKDNMAFSINRFEKLVLEMMGKKLENNFHIPSGATGGMSEQSESPAKSAELKRNTGNIAYNPLQTQNHEGADSKLCPRCQKISSKSANYCAGCGASLQNAEAGVYGISEVLGKKAISEPIHKEVFDISEVLGINGTQSFSETSVLGADEMGGTTVLGADVYEEPSFPYLVREATQEKISINKPSFRIGKESRYCDYFVSNNNAVSRSHADIITKDGRYYIIDNNSTNKTYVDGRVIPVQKEIEIFSGTKLKLANEEFVFYI